MLHCVGGAVCYNVCTYSCVAINFTTNNCIMMGPLPAAVLPTNLHIISVLHSGNSSSSRDCPIVIPAAAAGLGTAAGLQGNSDGKWSCLGRVPQFCEDTYIWMKTQSLENTPTGAFSMLKFLVMLSLCFEDEGFRLFHWGVFGQASQFQDNLFNAFIAKMCESTRPSPNSRYLFTALLIWKLRKPTTYSVDAGTCLVTLLQDGWRSVTWRMLGLLH